jgi:Mitotic-spindle organizing gamma-tubulin ring associated
MVDNTERGDLFNEQQKQAFSELAVAAGLDLRQEVLDIILELLALGAPPSSLATVLQAICRGSGAAGTYPRRPSATPTH